MRLHMVTLYYQADSSPCYTYSDYCDVSQLYKVNDCNDTCGQYFYVVPFTSLIVGFIAGWESEQSSPDSQESLAKKFFRTILKTILFIGALIYYFKIYSLLSNSECNGFSAETSSGLCTMTATFQVTKFLIIALTFVFVTLLHLFNLYLELYAVWACTSPIRSFQRPLLLDP